MKIEVLFPEICNLCGDLMNIRYLTQCEPSLEVVETDLKSRPRFLDEEIALVYLGSTTEKGLELIVRALGPVKDELLAKLEAGQLMLVTGNALDALSLSAESDEGWHLEGLGILPDAHGKGVPLFLVEVPAQAQVFLGGEAVFAVFSGEEEPDVVHVGQTEKFCGGSVDLGEPPEKFGLFLLGEGL